MSINLRRHPESPEEKAMRLEIEKNEQDRRDIEKIKKELDSMSHLSGQQVPRTHPHLFINPASITTMPVNNSASSRRLQERLREMQFTVEDLRPQGSPIRPPDGPESSGIIPVYNRVGARRGRPVPSTQPSPTSARNNLNLVEVDIERMLA